MSTPVNEPSSPPAGSDEVVENRLFDDPEADIILRSCDHREFRVLKVYIAKVSPVLRDLIQSASNSHDTNATASLPSIQLPDNGATLSSLLTFVLPMLPLPPSTVEQTMILLSAGQKYKMGSVLSHIRTVLSSQDPPFIRPETAFQVYSLAQTYGLREEALQAARSTLTFSFTLEDLESELGTIPGVYIRELWKYHQSVRAHLAQDLAAFKTASVPHEEIGQPCNNCTPPWLGDYIDAIAETPALFNINEFHMFLSRHINDRHCQCGCANIPSKAMHIFWVALSNVIHGCMTKAGSDFVIVGGPQEGTSPACPQRASPLPDHLDMSDADIIIQSCDLINFRIHKLALSLSSPFFRDMFSLPQPEDDEVVDGLPVVRLPEDAEVLNSLLTMLYPIPSVIPNSYDKSLMLLAASQKYDMVGILSRIRKEIQSRSFPTATATTAFREYAIASSGGLISERQTSARLTLYFPMTFGYICDALPLFESWALCDLVGFRKRCRDNLVSCFQSFLNLGNPPFNIWMSCTNLNPCQCSASRLYGYSNQYHTCSCSCSTSSSQTETGYSPFWLTSLFQQHLTDLNEAFTKPLLNPSSIREQYMSALQAHTKPSGTISCFTCAVVHATNGETFCKELENRLEQAISKAGLFHFSEEFLESEHLPKL